MKTVKKKNVLPFEIMATSVAGQSRPVKKNFPKINLTYEISNYSFKLNFNNYHYNIILKSFHFKGYLMQNVRKKRYRFLKYRSISREARAKESFRAIS